MLFNYRKTLRALLNGKWLIVILILMIVVSPLIVGGGKYSARMTNRLVNNMVNIDESAAGGRLVMYKALLDNFQSSPVIGHGIASWATMVAGLNVVDDDRIEPNITAPNEMLRVLAEDGFVGFALVMGMVLVFCARLRRAQVLWRQNPAVSNMALALLYSLVAFLMISNFYGVRGMINALPIFGLIGAFPYIYVNRNYT